MELCSSTLLYQQACTNVPVSISVRKSLFSVFLLFSLFTDLKAWKKKKGPAFVCRLRPQLLLKSKNESKGKKKKIYIYIYKVDVALLCFSSVRLFMRGKELEKKKKKGG